MVSLLWVFMDPVKTHRNHTYHHFFTQDLSAERIEEEKKKIVDYFADKPITIDTILLEVEPVQKKNEQHKPELSVVTGSGYIYETILDDLKFRISSSAFFQVSIRALIKPASSRRLRRLVWVIYDF